MEQYSFVDLEMAARRKTIKTHAERLTECLDKLVPWKDLCDFITMSVAAEDVSRFR